MGTKDRRGSVIESKRTACALAEGGTTRLHVALGPERARLEQRRERRDAARVDVEARLDVVERVGDAVRCREEGVGKRGLGLRLNELLEGEDAPRERRVHGHGRGARRGALGPAQVLLTEEELPAQVGVLDKVRVRHRDAALAWDKSCDK